MSLKLIVKINEEARARGIGYETHDPVTVTHELKTVALQQALAEHRLGRADHRHPPRRGSDAGEGALFLAAQRAIRMVLQGSAAGVLGPVRDQRRPGHAVRVQPLLDWTEADVWRYIQREKIPIPQMYFARRTAKRYRSLGCMPITQPVPSNAATIEEIIAELDATRTSERAGRAQDHHERNAMQKLRAKGFHVSAEPPRLKVVFVGHVDHGKSTLIGRILHDTGSLAEGKIAAIEQACAAEGMEFEYAFLLDALLEEQAQNITIDTTQIPFRTARRPYVIIDAPGHKEFLKNMITGAASADAAVLVIAADEGVREQSRRHGYLLSLLGIRQLIVVVNKMDLVGNAEAAFREIEREYGEFLDSLGLKPRVLHSRCRPYRRQCRNENAANILPGIPDPPCSKRSTSSRRSPRQSISRCGSVCRMSIVSTSAGSLLAGSRAARFASEISSSFLPRTKPRPSPASKHGMRRRRRTQSQVIPLASPCASRSSWSAATSASDPRDTPISANRFRAEIFWLAEAALRQDAPYTLRLATQEVQCQIVAIEQIMDSSTLAVSLGETEEVARNQVGRVTIQSRAPVVLDNHDRIPNLGRFVLVEEGRICGGGIVFGGVYSTRAEAKSKNIFWSEGKITAEKRALQNAHRGAVVWLTGLSGAGKSTIAQALEGELFARGMHTYVLDGDNIRHGLNSNLGFSPEDRVENIRRVSEVAKLLADSGAVAITAFISPYRADRRRAREIALEAKADFIEVFVDAPLQVCEERDPKQLYKKARAGQIREFTGIDAPYEAPEDAEITVRTAEQSVEESVAVILEELLPRLRPTEV